MACGVTLLRGAATYVDSLMAAWKRTGPCSEQPGRETEARVLGGKSKVDPRRIHGCTGSSHLARSDSARGRAWLSAWIGVIAARVGSLPPRYAIHVPWQYSNARTEYWGRLSASDCGPEEVRRKGAGVPRGFGLYGCEHTACSPGANHPHVCRLNKCAPPKKKPECVRVVNGSSTG